MASKASFTSVLKAVERGEGRSPLFWWMVEEHDRLKATWSKRDVRWSQLCSLFEEAGLTDRTGKPATIRTAKKTWARAQEAVRRSRLEMMTGVRGARGVAGLAPQPSSGPTRDAPPRTGRLTGSAIVPRLVPPVSESPPSSVSHQPPAVRPSEAGGPVSQEVAKARIDSLRDVLLKRSGR